MHSWLSCTLFLSCTLLLSCTLYCHALFSQNGGFCSEKTSNPPLLVTKKSLFWTKSYTFGGFLAFFCCIYAQFLTFPIANSSTLLQKHFQNTSQLIFLCSLPVLDFRQSCGPKPRFSIGSRRFLFWSSERKKVQKHFQNTSQLTFLMLPTSAASLVDFAQF